MLIIQNSKKALNRPLNRLLQRGAANMYQQTCTKCKTHIVHVTLDKAFPLTGIFSFKFRGSFKNLPGYLLTKLGKICKISLAGFCLHFYLSFRVLFFNFNFLFYFFFYFIQATVSRDNDILQLAHYSWFGQQQTNHDSEQSKVTKNELRIIAK